MTRNVEMRKVTFTSNIKRNAGSLSPEVMCKNVFSSLKNLYHKASSAKKEISSVIVEASEILADRTARKGLFGEDSDSNYCGTDVDYIPERAVELKYINYDMTGFNNARASSTVPFKNNKSSSAKNSGVLKCFNGF